MLALLKPLIDKLKAMTGNSVRLVHAVKSKQRGNRVHGLDL